MSLDYSFGPALGAELDYRRERIIEAASRTRRVRRARARRTTPAVQGQTVPARMGAARLAH